MKPYRLAYVVSHPIQYQAPLLKKLSAHPGIDLTVFFLSGSSTQAYHDPGFSQRVEWDVPLTDGYEHRFLESTENGDHHSLFNPKVKIASLKQALKQADWDAIWLHGYNNTALLYTIYFALRKKIPLLFRGESNLVSTSQGLFKNLFVRTLIRRVHGLLWVSSDNRDYYRHFGAQETQLFFTPYAVDNAFFQSFIDTQALIDEYCIVLFASKFIARKHAPLLIEAFAQLDPELQQQSQLWLVGSGEDEPAMQRLIDQHGLGERVLMLGFKNQTELPQYLNQCDVFVLPSEREPFGLIINEAMNLGKAIITTNEVGAARDLISDGENGWIVKAGDTRSLSTALSQAISDSSRLRNMGDKSLRRINQWSYEQDIEGIVAALDAIPKT